MFKNRQVYTGFATSIMVTVIGTVLGTLLTAMTAYPLSKSRLRGGKVLMVIVLITMIFSAGMIPSFLLIQGLGLMDNRLSLILPALVSAYNCIIMKNFFMSIPDSLEESARIDGARRPHLLLDHRPAFEGDDRDDRAVHGRCVLERLLLHGSVHPLY